MTAPSSGRIGLAHAAALIAGITVVARVAGFARTAVFGRAVGADCVGSVYQTVNTVPNIVFDIVAGGLLSALVVPILAPALHRADRPTASRIVSALLTWALLILAAAATVIAVLAGPITRALLGAHQCAGADSLGIRMLVVFAPQLLFYGVGVILGGALQAAERFTWPALAPLLSSLVVVAAYLTYGALSGPSVSPAKLPRSSELVLSVGTTLGVVVLGACQLPAALRLGLRIRPSLRFPAGVAGPVRRAAAAGAAALAAQQVATIVMLRLANSGTVAGTVVVMTLAQAVYLLPWAVLAVPVATSVFPRLSAAWDGDRFDEARGLGHRSMKAVCALAAIGTASLVSSASGIADLLLDRHAAARSQFAPAIAAFAVGLIGWSLVALLARTLYATRHVRTAGAAQVLGWLVAIGAAIALSAALPTAHRAVALALGNAIGVSVAAAALFVGCLRIDVLRLSSLADVARAIVAAALGSVAGWSVRGLVAGDGTAAALVRTVLTGVVGFLVAAVVVTALDRTIMATVRQLRRPASVAA